MSNLRLFHVQDGDRPMYVLAKDWGDALLQWQGLIRRENEIEPNERIDPDGISLVADHDELLLPGAEP